MIIHSLDGGREGGRVVCMCVVIRSVDPGFLRLPVATWYFILFMFTTGCWLCMFIWSGDLFSRCFSALPIILCLNVGLPMFQIQYLSVIFCIEIQIGCTSIFTIPVYIYLYNIFSQHVSVIYNHNEVVSTCTLTPVFLLYTGQCWEE
jgi:hypothetical protein